LLPAAALLLLAGCANHEVTRGRQLEVGRQPHLAYEEYLKAVAANPDDGAATEGLRRTAERAATYWLQRALTAAEQHQWTEAAKCYLKVLQIKPDQLASALALRQMAREHAEEVEQAYRSLRSGGLAGELLASAAEEGTPHAANDTPPGKKQPEPPRPVAEPSAKAPKRPTPPPKPPADGRKSPRRSRPVAVEPPRLARAQEPAGPGPRVDPHKQRPGVRREPNASQGSFVMRITLSQDDDRYPEKESLPGGLAVKLKDTDKSPLDADMEIYLDGRRIAKLKDLPPGSVIRVLDRHGTPWEIVILRIYDPGETVILGVRRG
jgi:hypothetical protein